MNGRMNHKLFRRQLHALLPTATMAGYSCRDWHSMTFDGEQILVTLDVSNIPASACQEFMNKISDYEFTLPGSFVADVSAKVATSQKATGQLVTVEALILKD